VAETVLCVPQHVGEDGVLTNELLRRGWRTTYHSTALVVTDAPSDWPLFWRQQLRLGRSGQRETLLSLPWLWRKPATFVSFAADIVTPFALYALVALAVAHGLRSDPAPGLPFALEVPLASGMVVCIGLRQIPRLRRAPHDIRRLPLFVLQITFFMGPVRIAAFATMFRPGCITGPDRPDLSAVRSSLLRDEPERESFMAMQGDHAS
jgi:hypothetical protein